MVWLKANSANTQFEWAYDGLSIAVYSPQTFLTSANICQDNHDQATGWMTKQSWLDSWQEQETYIFSQASEWACGPIKAPIQWVKAAVV
jgi:hypothetical protein